MSRITRIVERSQIAEEHSKIFDSITSSRGHVSGPFSVLLNSPEIAGRAAHLGAYIRFGSILKNDERELAIITTAREFDCDYEWSAHLSLAREAGVQKETIEIVANRGSVESLSSDEATIINYGRELLRGHNVCDATFQAAKTSFGAQGVTELTATIGYYGMLACALNAFQVEPEPNTPKLP